ncbi:MAG: hypothetical protein AB8H79_03035 [Myxococcota bacterium]
MRLMTSVALMWLNLCGTSGGRVGEAVGEVHQGQGWSVRLPPNTARADAGPAKVVVEPQRIAVDAGDFSRFFDIRWTDAELDLSTPLRTMALTECDPAVWDKPVVTDTTWTASALCTRQERFQWLIGRAEKHGDKALIFFYVANRDFLAYEDAWVDFANTAGTISSQAQPPALLDPATLRAAIREGAKDVGPSASPLPGGRVLSRAVVPKLTAVWDQRASLPPPPQRFTSPANPR